MMKRPWNDCKSDVKPFYRPVEAALRWCGLVHEEQRILGAMKEGQVSPGYYPEYPCLQQRTELILDAMEMKELPVGRDGRFAAENDHVAPPRRTVRHNDLKVWMEKNYPDQKPEFLFDEIERGTHKAINADSFRALQVELEANKKRLQKAEEVWRQQGQQIASLTEERDGLLKEKEDLSLLRKELEGVKDKQKSEDPLSSSDYWSEFKAMAERMVVDYPEWRKEQRVKVSKESDLTPWIKDELSVTDREVFVIKKILSDVYPELG